MRHGPACTCDGRFDPSESRSASSTTAISPADSQSKKISRRHCEVSRLGSPQKPHSLSQKALSQPQLIRCYFPKRLPPSIMGNFQRRIEKEMKTKSQISGHMIRSATYAVFVSVGFSAASSAFQWTNKWYKAVVATVGYFSAAKSPSQPRALSFAERVVYQRAIEDVYWRHRIWPRNGGENPDPKPSLDAVMSQAEVENKVTGYLRDSVMLQDYWQRPITAEQLQAEMDRMARDTRQPEVLRELFEALGNDPAVIAECLAKPILAEHLITDFSAQDQAQRIESPQTESLPRTSGVTTLRQVVYTL